MTRHRLTLALLLSFMLHLALLGAPGWLVPTLEDLLHPNASPPLEAHLARVSAVSAPLVRPNVPTPVPHREAHSAGVVGMSQGVDVLPLATDSPTFARQDPPETKPVPAETAPADPAFPALQPVPKLPSRGSIRFVISRGDQNFVIGQSQHRWSHDGKAYTLTSVTETTGIAAMFRPVRVVQTSKGGIGLDGLRPRAFHTEKDGVAGDAASFDWTGMKLSLSGGAQHEVGLLPGAQDMLSMFYQFSALFPWVPKEINEIWVTTGRKFERYAFKVLGEEKLPTKFGELRVLHLRTAVDSGEAIDIWAGLDMQGLPVKIRYADRQGETFDQNAEDIEYEGMPIPFKID